MTQAPRRVLAFLIGIDLTHYSRVRACRATKLSPRTVDRACAYLVEIGAIVRQRGGRSTPAKLQVIMTMEQFLAHQAKMAHQVAKNGAPSGPIRALEVVLEQKQPARKPQGVENSEPETHIVDPTGWSGSKILNPAWVRWRDRELRIARARDPVAYRRAIERREA